MIRAAASGAAHSRIVAAGVCVGGRGCSFDGVAATRLAAEARVPRCPSRSYVRCVKANERDGICLSVASLAHHS